METCGLPGSRSAGGFVLYLLNSSKTFYFWQRVYLRTDTIIIKQNFWLCCLNHFSPSIYSLKIFKKTWIRKVFLRHKCFTFKPYLLIHMKLPAAIVYPRLWCYRSFSVPRGLRALTGLLCVRLWAIMLRVVGALQKCSPPSSQVVPERV